MAEPPHPAVSRAPVGFPSPVWAAGPYEPPAAPGPLRAAAAPNGWAAGPFAPDWRGQGGERCRGYDEHPRRDARIHRKPSRTRRTGDAPRAEIGYEDWSGGMAVRPHAPAVRPAQPSAVHEPPAPSRDEDVAAAVRARAADQIERVARRVRVGDLRPLGLTAAMSEAGTLAATLAALLAPAT